MEALVSHRLGARGTGSHGLSIDAHGLTAAVKNTFTKLICMFFPQRNQNGVRSLGGWDVKLSNRNRNEFVLLFHVKGNVGEKGCLGTQSVDGSTCSKK